LVGWCEGCVGWVMGAELVRAAASSCRADPCVAV
jgi:hypothetical protein